MRSQTEATRWRPWRFGLRSALLFMALIAVITWVTILVHDNRYIWQAIVRHQTMRAAHTALHDGRYKDAIEAFDRVENMDGIATLQTRLGRGYSRWQNGEFADAGDDLYAAYQMNRDLAILDAVAYLRYRSGRFESSLSLYLTGSQHSRDQPELRHLSASIVAFEMHHPQRAGLGAIRAVESGLYPQIAHHLSALQVVELHERMNLDVARSMPKAVDHIERALALGSTYPRLRLDAVRVYALAVRYDQENPRLLNEVRRHAELAVAERISPRDLTSTQALRDLRDSKQWYADLIACACHPKTKVVAPTFPIDLLARPSMEQMLTRIDGRN